MENNQLLDLFKRANEAVYVCSDSSEKAQNQLKEYLANCEKAKELDAVNSLPYRGTAENWINKYTDLLISYHTSIINNPSWFVTGRGGRNMSKYNDKMSKIHDKLENLCAHVYKIYNEEIKAEFILSKKRRSATPKTNQEKAEILFDLYKILTNAMDVVKDKDTSYNDKLKVMIEYESRAREINFWYEPFKNSRIECLFMNDDDANEIEKIINTQQLSKDDYLRWFSKEKNIFRGCITPGGLIRKSCQANLAQKVVKYRKYTKLYDNKEGVIK